jgi:nicotinic acid mononucleotide adenylyltransferase
MRQFVISDYNFNQIRVNSNLAEVNGHLVILPTSANPLHAGHLAMLDVGLAMSPVNSVPLIDISVENADKGSLSIDEINRRLESVVNAGYHYNCSTYPSIISKHHSYNMMPLSKYGHTFLIGSDTFARMLNQDQFYCGNLSSLLTQLLTFASNLIVFDRGNNSSHSILLNKIREAVNENRLATDYLYNVFTKYIRFAKISGKYKNISSTQIRNTNATKR